jgi:hypothetical protein
VSPPIEFFVYRTSKIVERGKVIRLTTDWWMNYIAYVFIFICWGAYGGFSVYNFLQRPQFVYSSDILEYIQTPDFYEIRTPFGGGISYNHQYFYENSTIPPISHANIFSASSTSNYTVNSVCFNMNNTCSTKKSFNCYPLSKNEQKFFSFNYKLTPASIQFFRPTHDKNYFQNHAINTKENSKYYCSQPSISVRSISKVSTVESYEVNIEDNAQMIITEDNFGYYPIILLVLSTVSVFAYSRVFFMYIKERTLDIVYFVFTWKDVKNMKNRNEELKDIIKDQKKIEKERKTMERYMKKNNIDAETIANTTQGPNEENETITRVSVHHESVPQVVPIENMNLGDTNVIYRPVGQNN